MRDQETGLAVIGGIVDGDRPECPGGWKLTRLKPHRVPVLAGVQCFSALGNAGKGIEGLYPGISVSAGKLVGEPGQGKSKLDLLGALLP